MLHLRRGVHPPSLNRALLLGTVPDAGLEVAVVTEPIVDLRAEDLLDATAAAQVLGVEPRTVTAWAREGRLPCRRLGPKTIRWTRAMLAELAEEQRIASINLNSEAPARIIAADDRAVFAAAYPEAEIEGGSSSSGACSPRSVRSARC